MLYRVICAEEKCTYIIKWFPIRYLLFLKYFWIFKFCFWFQGENYAYLGSNYYWSVANQSCSLCPANYASGYGFIYQYQINPVTNRCYYIEKAVKKTFNSAQSTCSSVNGYLFPVGTIFEFLLAYSWTGGSKVFWLYGSKVNSVWYTWNLQTFSGTNSYWCLGN